MRWAAAAALALALLLPAAASGQTPPNRIGGWFLFGANMPWLNWNRDFGGGPGGGGVSGNIAEVDAKLQAAQTAGMHLVRWWVFEGGSPQIQRDGAGTPTGINPNVYTDLDAALTEAARYDIYYNLVLFGSTRDDNTTHQWWEDSAKRQALVRVLTPLFQRYASNPRVHTWEIVNEPEWQTRNGLTTVAGMLATADALTNAIHQNSRALVTVGQAQVQDMATWMGHPQDYYSPHYYDNFGVGLNDPFVNAATSPDGKPVVIGEFQAYAGLNPSAGARWQALYSGGYAGGWNWSLSPEHTGDHFATDLNAAAAFAAGKTDLGPRTGVAGARGFTLTAGPSITQARMNWLTGLTQTGYLILRQNYTSGASTLLPPGGPLPASATTYTDPGPLTGGDLVCYLGMPLSGATVIGFSDYLCLIWGSRSGAQPPSTFGVQLNQSNIATLTWQPPSGGAQDAYVLYAVPSDGSATRTQVLTGTAATASDNTAGVGTLYILVAIAGGVSLGQTDVLVAFPGASTVTAADVSNRARELTVTPRP